MWNQSVLAATWAVLLMGNAFGQAAADDAGDAAAAEAAAVAGLGLEGEESVDLVQVLMSGGPTMIPLAVLSVIAVMLIVIYFFSLRRGAVVSGRYMKAADALLRKGDYYGLLALSNRHNESVARVMRRTLDFMTKNPNATLTEAREIAETEGTRQASGLNQQIVYLADIGTIAPMIGLFGTVAGMIKAFSVVASGIDASRPMMLASGVAEALVTTAAGLVIGIPAMAAYAYFRGRVQALIADMEAATTQLMAVLSANFKPGSIRPID